MITADQRAEFSQQLRHRGRRKSAIPIRVPTSVKIPIPVYDALCRRATRERCSLHALMLRVLASAAPTEFPVVK